MPLYRGAWRWEGFQEASALQGALLPTIPALLSASGLLGHECVHLAARTGQYVAHRELKDGWRRDAGSTGLCKVSAHNLLQSMLGFQCDVGEETVQFIFEMRKVVRMQVLFAKAETL